MIGIGMPSSQRRIGSSVSTGWWFVTGKWDPLRFAQQVEPPIKSGTASNDSVLYRRNTVTPLQRIGI
jgi:hypothetical protein